MDLNDLNKTQLVLLALLVSFVTSIATGIVTVSLMEKAPESVTRTINRVVTQTIEKVNVIKEEVPAQVVLTVPPSEEDLIAKAAEKNFGTVKIRLGGDGSVVAVGMPVTPEGIMVSDITLFGEGIEYFVVYPDGKQFPLKLARLDNAGFSFFSPVFTSTTTEAVYRGNYVGLGDSNSVRLGQTILLFADDGLVKGFISWVGKSKDTVTFFKINLPISSQNTGNPIVTLKGEVVGMTFIKDGVKGVLPSNVIKDSLATIK